MTRLMFVVALASCQPAPVVPTAPPVDATRPGGTAPEAARGDAVEATFPLYGQGAVTLASMRGTVVVVELFSPEEVDWFEQHARWRLLWSERHADIEIITVATASDDTRAVASWDGNPPPHHLGWDPQGALALRLGVAELPALLVFDRKGRLAASGTDREAALQAALELLTQ